MDLSLRADSFRRRPQLRLSLPSISHLFAADALELEIKIQKMDCI